MLSTLDPNIIIVKDGNGMVYWPSVFLNMIGNMIPGEGYQIKMNAADVFTYPANSISSKMEVNIATPNIYMYPDKTGENMTLGILESAWECDINIGDEIGVFNQHGELVGSCVYEGNTTAIAVWGMDELTNEGVGCQTDEPVSIKLYRNAYKEYVDLIVIDCLYGDGSYRKDDIQLITKLGEAGMESLQFTLEQNSPNPFSDETIISFSLPHDATITLNIYDVLGNQLAILAHGLYEAGNHKVIFPSGMLAQGNYLYRITTNGFTATKQMSIAR